MCLSLCVGLKHDPPLAAFECGCWHVTEPRHMTLKKKHRPVYRTVWPMPAIRSYLLEALKGIG